MAIYSISDLVKLSGIKAHTIRAWEQRYGIIQPKRTTTNIRYYEDAELKQLLNIALLNKNGIKISKIAKMSEAERAEKIADFSAVNYEYDTQLDALTISMIELDEFKFNHILETHIQQAGFEATMLRVIYPFLDKLSILWLTGSVNSVQESFISNLIRSKLIKATDELPIVNNQDEPGYLLFLPEDEQQELSLLFMHYLLKARNKRSLYLGQNISLTDIKDAEPIFRPTYLFTIISETFVRQPIEQYLSSLLNYFPNCQVMATGYQVAVQHIPSHPRLIRLSSLQETLEQIDAPKPIDSV
ncbi:MAG: MerR family transcriptional regulator [Bacteroidota bacterium]